MSFRYEAAAKVFIVFLACILCLGVCFDMCFSGGCVSRVRVRGFWGVLWLVFCACLK